MNNIILFATYWNERKWITTSLAQIERIDPVEVIICDGCFDSTRENRSTDGTREIIEEWCQRRGDSARMISALRVKRSEAPWHMLRGLSRRAGNRWVLPRLVRAFRHGCTKNLYRINQALTFGHMFQSSRQWQPGGWFMTYDADQYYTDETLSRFSLCNEETEYGLLTARELTFPHDPDHCIDDYEKRTWNNMPHRIYEDTAVYPTRHLHRERTLSARLYHDCVPSHPIGTYHHYKFLDPERVAAGTQLGDRQPPREKRLRNLKPFTGTHPSVVRDVLKAD